MTAPEDLQAFFRMPGSDREKLLHTDLHMHTRWCDGKAAPEDMVRAALGKGMETIGFSCHSYTWFEKDSCITREDIPSYVAEIRALGEKYAGRIRIFCGVEQDYDSAEAHPWADYAIGSVHFLEQGGRYVPVDDTEAVFAQLLREGFGGDAYAMAEAYYAKVANVVRQTGADIIGHFDLIAKFNEGGKYFDESHPRYVAAWQKAADALLQEGKPFEVNTGGIYRGYRTQPYPNEAMRAYLRARCAALLLSSDAHCPEAIAFGFPQWEKEI